MVKWTKEKILLACKPYDTVTELRQLNLNLYKMVCRKQLNEQAFSHMEPTKAWNKKWTQASIVQTAAQYPDRISLITDNYGLYMAIRKFGLQEQAFAHMSYRHHRWTEQEILEESKRYSSRVQMQKQNNALYLAIHRRNLQDRAFAHMVPTKHPVWTPEQIVAECQQYLTRQDLQKHNPSAYTAVLRYGLRNEALAHMPKSMGESEAEKNIAIWLRAVGVTIQTGIWLADHHGRREIDICIPDCKIGVEYCGLYWHTEDAPEPRPRRYHYNKMKLAESQGIRLITIFEDEWLNRQEQVKDFLSSVLGLSRIKIAARKCDLRQIPKEQGASFLDTHHIQGHTRLSYIYFGLFYNEQLVGVISGGHHHRQGYAEALVLDRLCFQTGTTVQGGASRLFRALINFAKTNGFKCIVSWSDNRWSQGNVYRKLGFTLAQELPPDYSYVTVSSPTTRFSKQSLRKTPAERLTGKTERELRKAQGYSRIWDCGKKRWVFVLPTSPDKS